MGGQLRIAFVWDWESEPSQTITWKDGLAAALRLLSKKHEVVIYTMDAQRPSYVFPHPYFPIYVKRTSFELKEAIMYQKPDVILHWGDTTRPNGGIGTELGIPQALCFAGGHKEGESLHHMAHIFVESDVYKRWFESRGIPVSTAFGTNTDLYQPLDIPRLFDAFFPATFADWKRHGLWTQAVAGLRACAAGYMYDSHEQWCWQEPQAAGALVLPHLAPEALRRLYASSGCVLITSRSDGGSQRTVLEALAMNVPVVVTEDSDKTSEYLRDSGLGLCVAPDADLLREAVLDVQDVKVESRPYVLEKWSEFTYAKALENGLYSIV